jgi:hypothetical protein
MRSSEHGLGSTFQVSEVLALAVTVYEEPVEANNRLAELGLNADLLRDACRHGQLAWASCTSLHPRIYPGVAAWAETIAALREALIPKGWVSSEYGGLSLIVNPSGTIAIAATTGNEGTGHPEYQLTTGYSKGARTAQAVAVNHLQRDLFSRDDYLPNMPQEHQTRTTWFLLFRRDVAKRELLCELACPSNVALNGFIDAWSERIMIEPTPFDDDDVNLKPLGDVPGPDVEIEIKRRA